MHIFALFKRRTQTTNRPQIVVLYLKACRRLQSKWTGFTTQLRHQHIHRVLMTINRANEIHVASETIHLPLLIIFSQIIRAVQVHGVTMMTLLVMTAPYHFFRIIWRNDKSKMETTNHQSHQCYATKVHQTVHETQWTMNSQRQIVESVPRLVAQHQDDLQSSDNQLNENWLFLLCVWWFRHHTNIYRFFFVSS